MTLLVLFAIALFSRLGFWQIERAQEKKQMLAAEAKFSKRSPLTWNPGMLMPKQYQRIQVNGNYLPERVLLDNQHYQHQFGYHVLTPCVLNTNKVVLIDRGWIVGDSTRQTQPKPFIPEGVLPIRGSVYYPQGKHWVLGSQLEYKGNNLIIVEQLDTKLIGRFLHKSVYPFIIRLGKEESHGYVRDWPVVSMPPQRHYAYALQWFAMAFVVVTLFIGLNLKKRYETS